MPVRRRETEDEASWPRKVRYGYGFTQAEIDDGSAELESVPPRPAPPVLEQDEHWPSDWGTVHGDA